MPQYAAFLRGVTPTNCTMTGVKAAFEAAGFEDVRTVLGTGNVVFTAPSAAVARLERKAEAALEAELRRPFPTMVRPVDVLRALLAADPYAGARLAPGAKRVVSFLRAPPTPPPRLPLEKDGARVLKLEGTEVFTAYVPSPSGPVFMTLIQQAFGKEVTTRTWDTLVKVVRAAERS